MQVECLAVGAMASNCYLVCCEDTKEAMVIDPGAEGKRILDEVDKKGLTVKYIVNTHGHMDHIAANTMIKEATDAKLAIHVEDLPLLSDPKLNLSQYMGRQYSSPKADLFLCDGEELTVGKDVLSVLHTPGHTRGGISLKGTGVIFVGDTLFAGSVGRTDFPGGSYAELIASIKNKILPCGDEFIVYPGHGPATTVGSERANNPFL
ncbi:MAG TPA: MBL fold metallo-hydrolase [Peptococcaceae bacterium]|nr:MBL fold metallo-hydrolase [Peptococcaceae bacterium]